MQLWLWPQELQHSCWHAQQSHDRTIASPASISEVEPAEAWLVSSPSQLHILPFLGQEAQCPACPQLAPLPVKCGSSITSECGCSFAAPQQATCLVVHMCGPVVGEQTLAGLVFCSDSFLSASSSLGNTRTPIGCGCSPSLRFSKGSCMLAPVATHCRRGCPL